MAILVPAWDEFAVIASMLQGDAEAARLSKLQDLRRALSQRPGDCRGDRRRSDERIDAVADRSRWPDHQGRLPQPSLRRADRLSRLDTRHCAKAVVLHDAEDVVHPLELRIFDGLIDRAAVIQLPVLPLIDPASRWVSGHYCDEFAEAHIKELVVREAVGAAIPLAGVGCAIARGPLAKLAAHTGRQAVRRDQHDRGL